ncbi:Fanconi anemia group F protein isoform X2 [Seriola aureovittata]|uniref:Fanconi anemia group F protein isoform X2 n=1 Tax=Seriola aureovittata TaxID=2871759 RepID=UPI0024BE3451|nr:Fanconi anemia group F protein isoform X2 [Seriola aureovittata]
MRSVKSDKTGGGTREKRKRRQWLSTAKRLNCERRERHMEAVLKNLASTVELLAVAAHSGVVEQWDKQTLSRAFHWARYCEHLFSRFHNNSAVRRIMEKQLQLTNQSLQAAISGYTEVSFSDLPRCQHHLLLGLLNNPKLPSSIMRILFDSKSPADTKHNQSAVGADAEVQGVMLMERLGALMSQSSEACRTEHFLDSVLQGCERAAEHFCRVIAAALLTTENSASQTALQDFLMDWLQKKHMLMHMCSALPTTLLMDLAKEHLKFRDAYYDVLKKWASDMEYSISEGEWVQTSTNPTVSFQKLTEHFQALFDTCPSLRDDVEKELNALKISDGDFDVRGLSVWGDLLSVLNR